MLTTVVPFLTGSLSNFALVRIYSLAPDSTRDLTSRVLDCLSFLSAGEQFEKGNWTEMYMFQFFIGFVLFILFISWLQKSV